MGDRPTWLPRKQPVSRQQSVDDGVLQVSDVSTLVPDDTVKVSIKSVVIRYKLK